MSKQRVTLSVLLVVVLLVPGVILAQPTGPQSATAPSEPTGSTLFVENAGQWADAARFQAWGLSGRRRHDLVGGRRDLDHSGQ